jgi:hypothetical protein
MTEEPEQLLKNLKLRRILKIYEERRLRDPANNNSAFDLKHSAQGFVCSCLPGGFVTVVTGPELSPTMTKPAQ